MGKVSELIRDRRSELEMTQESLANLTGYSVAGIRKIEAGGVERIRNGKVFISVLNLNPAEWEAADAADRQERLFERRGSIKPIRIDGTLAGGVVPLIGRAAASGDPGKLIMLNEINEYVARPPELAGVQDAFAVFVYGDSMEPRYFSGEKVYIHPHRPLARGDFCVIQIGNPVPECAYVKRFVGMDEKQVRLEQYNPAKELTFPRKDVHSIGRIVASGSM